MSVDYSIDSAGDAALAGVGSGGLGILGAPVDIVNSITRGIEDVTRAGVNKLASINAPEGVDDPNSPNYDPDFYLVEILKILFSVALSLLQVKRALLKD